MVLHGSVLGSLLFRLHINNITEYLDGKMALRLLYIDDLHIYIQVPAHEMQQGVNLLPEAFQKIALWVGLHSLILNANKTKAIVFG